MGLERCPLRGQRSKPSNIRNSIMIAIDNLFVVSVLDGYQFQGV
jgi:hypothetical protein